MVEIIDVFDANYELVGTMERVAAHRLGLWHHTFHCWIVAERGDGAYLLLQLRSADKRDSPNMLDITAAGHLLAGELPEDGIRELEEELGVAVTATDLVKLGVKHDVMDEPGGIRNREFANVYLLRDDRPLEDYRLQADEVSGLVELPIEQGLELFAGETDHVDCAGIRLTSDGVRRATTRVAVASLIPRVDQYYLKVLLLAQLYLAGHRHLAI